MCAVTRTDSDATALLEATRASDITPVQAKSAEQQGLQGLHRIRAAWRGTRTARVNTLRGLCREFGIVAPLGVERGLELAEADCAVPAFLRVTMQQVFEELRALDERLLEVEAQLGEFANQSALCRRSRALG